MTTKQLRKALKHFPANEQVVILTECGYMSIIDVKKYSIASENPAIVPTYKLRVVP